MTVMHVGRGEQSVQIGRNVLYVNIITLIEISFLIKSHDMYDCSY